MIINGVSYRFHLLTLHLRTSMYLFELYNIIFVIEYLKNPTSSFIIYNFIDFYLSSSRLSHANKLIHHRSSNFTTQYLFLNRVTHLWNVLPIIDLSLPTSTLINKLKKHFWNHFVDKGDVLAKLSKFTVLVTSNRY